MSVLCKICEFGTSGVDVLEVSLQGVNALKPSSFLPCYAADVQIYCTRKCTNRLQYNGFASARSNPQGIVFLKAKFKSKLI
jgi:hypothetical protein